jgi:outer membrane biosynthesis protein TonB
MAKKRPAKKATKTTKKPEPKLESEEIVLGPNSKKALKLVEKSAKVRVELEKVITLAVDNAVRKVMKANKIELTASEANILASIWFGECE